MSQDESQTSQRTPSIDFEEYELENEPNVAHTPIVPPDSDLIEKLKSIAAHHDIKHIDNGVRPLSNSLHSYIDDIKKQCIK